MGNGVGADQQNNGVAPAVRGQALAFPLLGLDISATKIGLAVIDDPSGLPQPLYTYHRQTRERDLVQCCEWVAHYHIGGVVIGLPLNMDGSTGSRAQWMQRFVRHLRRRLTVPVVLQDERLTTAEGDELLLEQGISFEERELRIDAVAAALILERYLKER